MASKQARLQREHTLFDEVDRLIVELGQDRDGVVTAVLNGVARDIIEQHRGTGFDEALEKGISSIVRAYMGKPKDTGRQLSMADIHPELHEQFEQITATDVEVPSRGCRMKTVDVIYEGSDLVADVVANMRRVHRDAGIQLKLWETLLQRQRALGL